MAWSPKFTFSVTWDNITGKPLNYPTTWSEVSGKPSTFTPSSHTHTIANVTGLQGALDSKWDVSAATSAGLTQTTSLRVSDWDSLLGGTSGFVSGTGSASNAPFGNAGSGVYSAYSASAGFVLAFSGSNDEVYARTAATSGGWNDWKTLATDGENTFTTTQYLSTTSSGSRKIELVHATTGANGGIRVTNTPTTYVYASGGSVQLRPDGETSTTGMLSVAANGNVTISGNVTATNVTASSDPRLKTKIKKAKARRELIDQLEYFSFEWIKDGAKGRSVMADKVQEIAPEHVHVGEEDGMLSVDKGGLALEMVLALIDKLKEES